jgi:hypothetical protein
MSIFADMKRKANLVKARAKLDEQYRVFQRERNSSDAPWMTVTDLGVMSNRKYKALKQSMLVCYVASLVGDNDAHRQFVEFYKKEMA